MLFQKPFPNRRTVHSVHHAHLVHASARQERYAAKPMPDLPFAAALLAGGRSTRMGRDKAGLEIDGQPLWRIQLDKLRALHPAELYISGRPDGPYAGEGTEIVCDALPGGLGPLAGLAAVLERAQSPRLLILAIDLPRMTTAWLHQLLEKTRPDRGCVPERGGGFEPLAALYPRTALPFIQSQLVEADRSLHACLHRLRAANLLETFPISAVDEPLFQNWNTPADVDRR